MVMTQAEFDELLCWLIEDWVGRHVRGEVMPVAWDELSLDLARAVGGVVRFGQARGFEAVTVAVGARAKAALARVRACYADPALSRVAADG
jgi:hypothetical protein